VSEGLRKSSQNVTIFFAEFQCRFDSLYLSLSSVSLLSAFLFFSCLFATIYGEYRCIFTAAERYYSLASTRADILCLSINRQQYECVNNLPSVGVSWRTAKIVPAVTQSFVEYTVRTVQRNKPKITQ